MNEEKIFSKIRKLLSLSESPERAEAEEAARKIHALLLKYNLSMQDVTAEPSEIRETIYERGWHITEWKSMFINAVARANFCIMYTEHYKNGTYKFIIVGREYNIKTATWMSDYLLSAIKRISKREIPRFMEQTHWDDYQHGIAAGIMHNLKKLNVQDAATPETRALVSTEMQLIQKRLDEEGVKTKRHDVPLDSVAFIDGYIQGLGVSLNDQIDEMPERREIGP